MACGEALGSASEGVEGGGWQASQLWPAARAWRCHQRWQRPAPQRPWRWAWAPAARAGRAAALAAATATRGRVWHRALRGLALGIAEALPTAPKEACGEGGARGAGGARWRCRPGCLGSPLLGVALAGALWRCLRRRC